MKNLINTIDTTLVQLGNGNTQDWDWTLKMDTIAQGLWSMNQSLIVTNLDVVSDVNIVINVKQQLWLLWGQCINYSQIYEAMMTGSFYWCLCCCQYRANDIRMISWFDCYCCHCSYKYWRSQEVETLSCSCYLLCCCCGR